MRNDIFKGLSKRDIEILSLYYYDNFSQRHIARIFGLKSIKSLYNIVQRFEKWCAANNHQIPARSCDLPSKGNRLIAGFDNYDLDTMICKKVYGSSLVRSNRSNKHNEE